LGKKTDAINRLKAELTEKTAALFALEAREKALREQLSATESEHAVKLGSLREAERLLAAKDAELAKVNALLDEQSARSDTQRIEVVALRTQVDALKERVTAYEREAREIEQRLENERAAALQAGDSLSNERARWSGSANGSASLSGRW